MSYFRKEKPSESRLNHVKGVSPELGHRAKTKALMKRKEKKGCGCAYHDSNGKCTNYPS